MGKKQKHGSSSRGTNNKNNVDGSSSSSWQHQNQKQSPAPSSWSSSSYNNSSNQSFGKSIENWLRAEQQGILWVLGCVSLGCLFGFGVGSGVLTGDISADEVAPWRIELGFRIRASLWYQMLFFWQLNWFPDQHYNTASGDMSSHDGGPLHPSHPRIFAVLREAVVREKGGFVHHDLGLLSPAPCGAARGLGMVRDSYHNCQSKCFPGIASEKVALRRNQQAKLERNPENRTLWLPPISKEKAVYKQEEVLVRVPLAFQMTRSVALDTIMARLPTEVQRKANPHELDDAALLVLLLAHERGVGRHSRWLPYIATLPKEPSCGYNPKLRPYILNSMNVLQEVLEVDTSGWKGELSKAQKHASKIAQSLAKDYGAYIKTPEGMKVVQNIEWALCQVSSRAIAGSEQFGALRLVPLLDLANHDANAGGFVELTGKERLGKSMTTTDTADSSGFFLLFPLTLGDITLPFFFKKSSTRRLRRS